MCFSSGKENHTSSGLYRKTELFMWIIIWNCVRILAQLFHSEWSSEWLEKREGRSEVVEVMWGVSWLFVSFTVNLRWNDGALSSAESTWRRACLLSWVFIGQFARVSNAVTVKPHERYVFKFTGGNGTRRAPHLIGWTGAQRETKLVTVNT